MASAAEHSQWTAVAQFSFVFTALVTVVGWFFSARQAEAREFRKEVREQISSLTDRALKVRDSTVAYWLEKGGLQAPKAIALKADVMSLARQLQTLRMQGLDVSPHLMAEIRRMATGGNFEQKNRRRSAQDANRVFEVAGAIEDLLIAVDELFYAKFPVTKPSRWPSRWPLLLALTTVADTRH